jgi:NADH-quinone oxidoreductase subunit K
MQGILPAVPLSYYLFLSAILFVIGVSGVIVKRNPIVIFMCVELMLNAVNLSLIAFSRFQSTTHVDPATGQTVFNNPQHYLDGQMMVIFVLAVAAAEVSVGLGILVSIFRQRASINVDEIDLMRG